MSIYHELAMRGSHVHVSVLCPGWIRTRIIDAERNWPDRLGSPPAADTNPTAEMMEAVVKQLVASGMDPAMVAEQVLDAVRSERFWVLPNASDFGPAIKEVAAGAVEGRNPPLAPMA
jgi:short-subunit dehydrogenase